MSKSLYFYDLETTGFNPREARIMQFAGQRTDLNLKPIGEPQNVLVKLSDEVLPDPGAIMVTGITPQQTIADGLTEAEFLRYFHEEVVKNDTVFVGYNSVRFDDEFMRYLHYRNFYDPYEWQWRDGKARWDLMDVVRMMRALRPDGIKWPIQDGKPSNRLELITKENNISHVGAHDALSDVNALIDLAKLINTHQPKLFSFLLELMTNKNNIAKLIDNNEAFVYTSSKYSSDFEKTTIVSKLADHPKRQGALVFDLRFDPADYADLTVDELVNAWRPEDKDLPRLPVKTLQYNRCPAVAPIGVVDELSYERIKLTSEIVKANYAKLQNIKSDLSKKILQALDILDADQEARFSAVDSPVDAKLYDGFFGSGDKQAMEKVRQTRGNEINTLQVKFSDKRLNQLLPLYKARNYRKFLSTEDIENWEKYKLEYLMTGNEESRLSKYFTKLSELEKDSQIDSNRQYLIDELKLYGESIIPTHEI
jgi:exodeoxyribonuclease-1